MNRFLIYIIAILEGSALMGVQLLYSRIIAAGYGITLNVWSILISVSLAALAAGYFSGARISQRSVSIQRSLLVILLLSAVLLFILPLLATVCLESLLTLNTGLGLLLFCILFISPVILLFGMVSPILIEILSKESDGKALNGKISGRIYAVSTVGGIIGTFLFGLYFIPYNGIYSSVIILSVSLLMATIVLLVKMKIYSAVKN